MVDLVKYSGLWHEIFKIPFKWETGCTGSTADYQVLEDGTISLENTCYLEDGKSYSRSGFAVLDKDQCTEENTVMQKLIIEFNDGKISDGPAPYWIHYTDYHFSVVGGPTEDFMWLLARKPEINNEDLIFFSNYVEKLGYNLDNVFLQKNVKVL